MASLQGKVAVITGASSGVGWHTAKLFAQQGCSVVVTARREERLKQLCAEIASEGGEAVYHAGDAAAESCAQAAIDTALKAFGRIDIVVCNAGQGNYKQLVDTSVAEYDELMNSNMRSSFLFARYAAPHLIQQRSGVIIFISSVAGIQGTANEAVYSASKFAQVGFAQALEAELRGWGIKVTVLCPGGIKTEFAVGKGRTAEKVAASYMMQPQDFAGSILFACTQPENSRITQMTVRHMGEPNR